MIRYMRFATTSVFTSYNKWVFSGICFAMLSVSHSSCISRVSLVYRGIVVNALSFCRCCSVCGINGLPFSCLHPPMLLPNVIPFFALLKSSCLITRASVLTLHTSTPFWYNPLEFMIMDSGHLKIYCIGELKPMKKRVRENI